MSDTFAERLKQTRNSKEPRQSDLTQKTDLILGSLNAATWLK